MASRGSVIPLFVDLIKAGKPLTITNPNMTRFLMNLDEAVDLVLFAFKNANQGDLFVQKSPASSIADLTAALQELFDPNAKIKVIGTRHGEKAHETLLTLEERVRAEELENYFRVPADTRDLNYGKYFNEGEQDPPEITEYNSANTEQLDIKGVIKKLKTTDYIKKELAGKESIAI